MRTRHLFALAISCAVALPFLMGQRPVPAQAEDPAPEAPAKPQRPRACIETSQGRFVVELFDDEAPKTVANFLELAEGRRSWTDPKSLETKQTPFYDGLTFHRVIDGFMIQGGCPRGDGTGGPGYTFEDEINATALGLGKLMAMSPSGAPHPYLGIRDQAGFSQQVVVPYFRSKGIKQEDFAARAAELEAELKQFIEKATLKQIYELQGYVYDDSLRSTKPTTGSLAMANSGPNTNGSQFFVNLGETPHLTGKHTVFGKVVDGMDVVRKIGKVAVGAGGRPVEPVKIVTVRRVLP